MPYELPPLPYAHDALEPFIDEQTMQIHHGKHHQAYVNNLNAALEKYPELQGKPIEELIADLNAIPGRHPHGRPQQRRRARQPRVLLDAHGPNAGGAPTGRSPRRSTPSSAPSTRSRKPSRRPARRASAAAGRG